MSGPKHLWSGDWRRESEAASAARGRSAARVERVPEPQPDEPTQRPQAARRAEPAKPAPAKPAPPTRGSRPRRRLKRPRLSRAAALAAAVVLVLGGAAYGLVALLGTSTHPAAPSGPVASAATQPAVPSPPANAIPAPRLVKWLGMLIVTQPPGVAIVQTVQIGSVADRAGISPGDVLLAVDGRPIHGGQDIAGALSGLNRGDRVSLQMGYGSGFSQTVVTLGAAPSVQP